MLTEIFKAEISVSCLEMNAPYIYIYIYNFNDNSIAHGHKLNPFLVQNNLDLNMKKIHF